jgi:hypothetical protein
MIYGVKKSPDIAFCYIKITIRRIMLKVVDLRKGVVMGLGPAISGCPESIGSF